jgi:hypothetical protein
MTKPPPVPKENQSPKGTGDGKAGAANAGQSQQGERNLQEQGRQGNIKQNTTNQGYQQDR